MVKRIIKKVGKAPYVAPPKTEEDPMFEFDDGQKKSDEPKPKKIVNLKQLLISFNV